MVPFRHLQSFAVLVVLVGLLIWSGGRKPVAAQESSTTPAKSVSIIPADQRPNLMVRSSFQEPSGNGLLDAAEKGSISLTLINKGQGPAEDVEVWVEPQSSTDNVRIGAKTASRDSGAVRVAQLNRLASSVTHSVSVPLRAARRLSGQSAELDVTVKEKNGFGLDQPHTIMVDTESYQPPTLTLAGYDVSNSSEQSIRPGTTSTVTLRVENTGLGTGRGLQARVEAGQGGTLTSSSQSEFALETLEPKAASFLTITVNAKAAAKSVPLQVHFRSTEDPYRATERLTLPVAAPDRPPLVDREIPSTVMERPHAVAVVVGVREYQGSEVPNVDYAVRDAQTMKSYLTKTLGFRSANVIELMNPTKAEMDAVFGTAETHEGRLHDYLRSDTSEVFVYYSGHGAPNPEEDGRTYFLPSNGSPQQLSITGYPVHQLYENLAKLTSGPVTVAIDACFSGQSEGGTLIRNASPALLSVENPMVGMENGMVMTASEASQISSWYPEKKHGLFTYFLLKGLRGEADQDQNGVVTGAEMKAYLTENVSYYARRLHSRTQDPQVMGKGTNRVLVRYPSDDDSADSSASGR